jgi:hypothetical protein
MNYTISYTDFRKNMSKYSDIVNMGKTVTVKDEKKGISLFKVIKADEDNFDGDEYIKFVEGLGGSGLLASKEDEKARTNFRNSLNKRFAEAKSR